MAYAARQIAREERPVATARKLRVVNGTSQSRSAKTAQVGVSSTVFTLIKIAACIVVMLFAIGVVRVSLNVQTVATMMETNKINKEISTTASEGDDLLVQKSIYGNPTRIEGIAQDQLGMVAANTVTDLNISGGVAGATEEVSTGSDTDMVLAENTATQ